MSPEERIVELERKLRRNRWMNATAVATSTVAVMLSLTTARRAASRAAKDSSMVESGFMKCRGFSVIDEAGREAVRLDSTKPGGRILVLDPSGKPAVALVATEGGTGLVGTFNRNGASLVTIASSANSNGFIEIRNRDGKQTIGLGTTTDGDGFVSVADHRGNEVASLSTSISMRRSNTGIEIDSEGMRSWRFHSGKEKYQTSIGLWNGLTASGPGGVIKVVPGFGNEGYSGPAIRMFDANGGPRMTATLKGEGEPSLRMYRTGDSTAFAEAADLFDQLLRLPFDAPDRKALAERVSAAASRSDDEEHKATALVLGVVTNVRPEIGVTEQRPVNSICLYGPDAKLIWKAP